METVRKDSRLSSLSDGKLMWNARLYCSCLVGHAAAVESSEIGCAGKCLAPDWSFVPPKQVGILDGLQQHVVWAHTHTMCPKGRSPVIAGRADKELNPLM